MANTRPFQFRTLTSDNHSPLDNLVTYRKSTCAGRRFSRDRYGHNTRAHNKGSAYECTVNTVFRELGIKYLLRLVSFSETFDIQFPVDTSAPNVHVFRTDNGNIAMFIAEGNGQVTAQVEIQNADDTSEGAGKEGTSTELPDGFSLTQNYPNPTTRIDFSLAKSGPVTLEVYNIQGQKVTTLIDGTMSAGEHTVEWDATSETGAKISLGIYFYRLTAGDVTQSKKMILAK